MGAWCLDMMWMEEIARSTTIVVVLACMHTTLVASINSSLKLEYERTLVLASIILCIRCRSTFLTTHRTRVLIRALVHVL